MGVTALMVASCQNNVDIVNVLILRGCDLEKEDKESNTALCHALSSAVIRNVQPPNAIVSRLIEELQMRGFSLTKYLQVLQSLTHILTFFFDRG